MNEIQIPLHIKISVIITAYNVGKYIEQCVSSIRDQTYPNLEIIVVDDGSEDDTARILRDLEKRDARLRIITQSNQGGGAARNAGLEAATGEYLSILDGDDFYERDMLECALKKSLEHNADIVIFDAFFYDNESGHTGRLDTALREKYIPDRDFFCWSDIPEKIFNISDGYVWNKLYKRELIERNRLRFQTIRRIDDLLFEMQALMKADRICTLKKSLCYYRCNNQASQQGRATQTPDTFYEAFFAVKEWLIQEAFWAQVQRSFVNRALEACKNNLDLMRTGPAFEAMYEKLKSAYFDRLGIVNRPEWYYSRELYGWYASVIAQTPVEYLFDRLEAVRAVNGDGGIRFLFPKHLIGKGQRIALYGAGNMGRAYYAQVLSSRYCDILVWADKRFRAIGDPVKSPDEIKTADFEYVLVAVESGRIADEIVRELTADGIEKEKIVWAMEE